MKQTQKQKKEREHQEKVSKAMRNASKMLNDLTEDIKNSGMPYFENVPKIGAK
jgi:hypothetical protein